MTIAAGFVIRDGILLCADTQFTGAERVHRSKIFPIDFGDCRVAIAMAGSEAYGAMAADLCVEEIIGIQEKNIANMTKAIRRVVRQVHREHVDKRPVEESAAFQLLVAMWHKDGARLLRTFGTAVSKVSPWAYIGSGEYLAHFLAEPIYHHALDVKTSVALASLILAAVKRYDAYCGGSSEMVLVGPNPSFSVGGPRDSMFAERYMPEFESHSRRLMLSFADHSGSDAEFGVALQEFNDKVRLTRRLWRANVASYDNVSRSTPEQQ